MENTKPRNLEIEQFEERNVVILFPDELNEIFISFSQEINRKIPSKIVLNGNDTLPHLTIYGVKYPTKSLEKLEPEIETLILGLKPFSVRLTSKSIVAGTIFIDAEIDENLYKLHERIVDTLNPLREGVYNKEELTLPDLTEDMRQSLVTYGNLLVKDQYKPHVTIARPIDSNRCQEALDMLPKKINYTSLVFDINLAETGPNGTCRSIIRSFNF